MSVIERRFYSTSRVLSFRKLSGILGGGGGGGGGVTLQFFENFDPHFILRIFQKIQPPQFYFHPLIICKMNSILCSGKVFMIKSVSKMLITHLNFTYIRGQLRIVNENGTVPTLSIGQRCINIGP